MRLVYVLDDFQVITTTTIVYTWSWESFEVVEDTSTAYESKTIYRLCATTYTSAQCYLTGGIPLGEPVTNNPTPQSTSQTYTRIHRKVQE